MIQSRPTLPAELIRWREPAQERSVQRFDKIVETAGELLASGGMDYLTMDRLASTSNTSMGSLYHFFPDREAVLAALANRVLGAMYASYVSLAKPENLQKTPEQSIRGVYQHLLEALESVPGAHTVLRLSDSVPAIGQVKAAYNEANAQMSRTYLQFKFAHLSPRRRDIVSRVFLELCESLTMFLSTCDKKEAKAASREVEAILAGYLQSLVE